MSTPPLSSLLEELASAYAVVARVHAEICDRYTPGTSGADLHRYSAAKIEQTAVPTWRTEAARTRELETRAAA